MGNIGSEVVERPRYEALPVSRPEPRLTRAATGEPPERSGFEAGHRDAPSVRRSWPARILSGIAVLVVDDDEASLDYFAMALRMVGATVPTATTAAAALRTIQQRHFDVVLSDIAMPERDGYWLVSEIRALPEALRDVPVIATTAYGAAHSRQRALAAGFVEHLPKPVEPDVLCTTVARVAEPSQ